MIVTYLDRLSIYMGLKLNSEYLVKSISGNDMILFGYNKKVDKTCFVKEDGSEIEEENYTSDLCIGKRNVEKGDEVLCIENFGNQKLIIGEIYTVAKIEYYVKGKYRLQIKEHAWEDFEPNMFIRYDKKVERYQKSLKIFNDISLFKE